MADEKPGLHIDTDWKRQAQEEKRRLQEEEERKRAAASSPAAGATAGAPGIGGVGMSPDPRGAGAAAGARAPGAPGAAGQRDLPPATLATLIQSLMTQVLYYLGELSVRGGQPMLNLDMAKHNIDLLNVLEEKTRNNLTDDEKRLLDAALYETRMRYVGVASQFTGP